MLINTKHVFVLLGLSAIASSAMADDFKPVSKTELIDMLIGQTVIGEYRLYRDRTKTFNYKETYLPDFTTDYSEGQIRAKGQWYMLTEFKKCYTYTGSADLTATPSCYWTYYSNGCYYDYQINQMTPSGPKDFDDWGARWVIEGSGGSCAVPLS